MERRHFLKLAVGLAGFAAGTAALAAGANAAPLAPHPIAAGETSQPGIPDVQPAVTTEAEVLHLTPEQVRSGHHWHHRWHRHWHRHWHRRRWHRWHRHHWHRHHWHRRHW